MKVFRHAILSIAVVAIPTAAPAQERPGDNRGLVHESNAPPKPQQPPPQGATQARPELVLQSGISEPQVRLVFSPDARLLASIGISGGSIKLWEVATGRLLRQFSTGTFDAAEMIVLRPLAFSSDGAMVVTVADRRLRRWDVKTGRELASVALTLPTPPYRIVMSDDSSVLATATIDRLNGSARIRSWEVSTGREISSVTPDQDQAAFLETLALSPNGQRVGVVTSGTTRTGMTTGVSVWDVASGRRTPGMAPRPLSPTTLARANQAMGVAFSPDGSRVALREEATLTIWDIASGREIASTRSNRTVRLNRLGVLGGFRSQIEFSADGRLVGMQADDGALELVDVGKASVSRVVNSHDGAVVETAFSRDGRILATSGVDTVIAIRDLATGAEIQTLRGQAMAVTDVAFSTDGRSLAVAGTQSVGIWDVGSGDLRRALTLPDEFQRAAWERTTVPRHFLSPDGRHMVAGSKLQPKVKVWDVSTGAEVSSIALAEGRELSNAIFSSDGRIVAVIDRNDERTRAPSPRPPVLVAGTNRLDPSKILEAMQKNPKGARAKELREAIEKMSKAADSGNPAEMLEQMDAVGLVPEGNRPLDVAYALRVFDEAGRPIRDLPFAQARRLPMTQGASDELLSHSALSLSPDGHYLALVTEVGGPMTVTDITTGQVLSTIEMSTSMTPSTVAAEMSMSLGMTYAMAWSPDSAMLAAGGITINFDPKSGDASYVHSIDLRDPGSGSRIRQIVGLDSPGIALAFSHDGKRLASAGFGGAIQIWDVASGLELLRLTGHSGPVSALAFGVDDRYLLSGGDDGSARLWDLRTGDLLATLVSTRDSSEWLVVTPDGLFDGSPGGWGQVLWRFSEDLYRLNPVESFFADFYHPGLLAELLAGSRPKAALDIAQRSRELPTIRLALSGTADTGVTGRTCRVSVAVTEATAGARDVRLFRNGSLVRCWRGDVLDGRSATTIEADVTLVAGPNRLVAYAFNRDNVKSVDATLEVEGPSSLARPGTVHVLAVGVNEYTNPQFNLKYATADAQDFAAEVERQQRRIGVFGKIETTILVDRDATKTNVLLALGRLAGGQADVPADAPPALGALKPAEPEDAVVIFFAGHGTAQGDRFYLLPHDLGYQGERALLDAEGLRTIFEHGISDVELERALERIDAGHSLVVIDACNSGQALESEDARRGPMNSRGLAQLAYDKGMYVLTAAQSYQVALEATSLKHGLLTFALVEEGLKTASADGRPHDGRVELREWLDFATDRVPRLEESERKARGLVHEAADKETTRARPNARAPQRPRVFYRRELETQPLVVARP